MFKKLSRNRAFSLIELSMTLVVIGVIIVGVAQGLDMSKKFKLSSARSLTAGSPAVSIKGLALWLDATSEKAFSDPDIANSSEVETWLDTNIQRELDKTNLTQTTSSKRPLYISDAINGLPSIKFDGINDNLSIANLPGYKILQPQEVTMFLVVETDPTVGDSIIIKWGEDDRFDASIPWASNGNIYFDFDITDGRAFYTPSASDAIYKPHIFSFIHRSNETSEMRMDGVSKLTETGLDHVMDTSASFDLFLGALDNSANNPWKGFIGELLIFNRGLTALEVSQMEAYLGQKWGIKTPL